MPSRSSTRAAAAFVSGAPAACPQLSSTSMRRAWRGAGHAPTVRRGGSLWAMRAGSNGRIARPTFTAAVSHARCGIIVRSAARSSASSGLRPTLLIDQRTPNFEQPFVAHARGASRLAGPALQAAVEMQLRLCRGRRTFQHGLEQIDAAARPVELVAEQLIGRTGRVAEAAVHAFAQDAVGLAALRRVLDEGREIRLHNRRLTDCFAG